MNLDRRHVLMGTSVTTAVAATAGALKMDIAKAGVTGDGVADDTAAIQAALDQVGSTGGGVVYLPEPKVCYRITRGLRLPSYVVLEGPTAVQYPFNDGLPGACRIVADFADPNQWIIEPATQRGGAAVRYNDTVTGGLPDGVTYNCGVRNLLITSSGKIPFGGIRMHGCPGARVEGVAINRVGCGLLINMSFGGSYDVHTNTMYYGVAVWDEANANKVRAYVSRFSGTTGSVPPAYRLSFLDRLHGRLASEMRLSDQARSDRAYGIVCGATQSTSTGNQFDVVIEQFPGSIFLCNAYATEFRQCYLEAAVAVSETAITATRSRFNITSLHAYQSGSGSLFDFGLQVLGRVYASGIIFAAKFGHAPLDDGSSHVILENIGPGSLGAPIHRAIRYLTADPQWESLRLAPGWKGGTGDDAPAVRYDAWSHRVELRGKLSGGRGVAAHLTGGLSPASIHRQSANGTQVAILPDGSLQVDGGGGPVDLGGISFPRW